MHKLPPRNNATVIWIIDHGNHIWILSFHSPLFYTILERQEEGRGWYILLLSWPGILLNSPRAAFLEACYSGVANSVSQKVNVHDCLAPFTPQPCRQLNLSQQAVPEPIWGCGVYPDSELLHKITGQINNLFKCKHTVNMMFLATKDGVNRYWFF